MSFIGIFSIFVLIATFIAVGLILYMTSSILAKSPADVEAENHIKLTEEDRNYKQFDLLFLPVFCANMMSLFEGNQMILNLYSEADKPENFFMQACVIIVCLTLLIACAVGYIGYLAFGETTKSVILYNLPNDDSISITAKCLYILTICGSFVLLIQPIYSIMERSGWYNNWFCPNEKPEEGLNDENKDNDDEKKSKAQKEGGQEDKQEEPSV
jgi:amino acid permease